MATATASAIRPGLRDNRQLSGSPHTPTSRFISSNYSSPGSTFRQEEDAVIIELDARLVKAGFEGESAPQCVIPFTPESARRVGDYREWLPGYKPPKGSLEDSVSDYELWRDDLGHGLEDDAFDLGLLEDKLERAVRDAYNTYLLTDAGTARLVLVLPSVLPRPILSAVLSMLFGRWKFPSISLLPRPTVCLAAAGMRSGIVVDIGWHETTITPVYEYREMKTSRSIRGMKTLTLHVGRMLESIAEKQAVAHDEALQIDLPFVEDFVYRMARCESQATTPTNEKSASRLEESPIVTLDWPTDSSSVEVSFPLSTVTEVVDECFLPSGSELQPDDEELPLPELLYNALLHLPPDVRAICMARITFVGAGSTIPNLRQAVVTNLEAIVARHGWTPVRGTHVAKGRQNLTLTVQNRSRRRIPEADDNNGVASISHPQNDTAPTTAEGSTFEDKLQKQLTKDSSQQSAQQTVQGQIRCVESLGAWAGASLLTSLKVKAVVEIERSRFLESGIAGATRDRETDAVTTGQRASSGGAGAVGGGKAGERTSWTLGVWA
ncbi:Actin-related protein 10 [Cyphellophora attinorum]|uniref:Actin-related protein 10 n=1 Tax=Cyphellophora attinorum TaxID=1664694 RepID=A0A0N1H7X7_9EURO|nr:Actin-related protein 10 [Phialophora attinorum]KPI42822.1 Actin-related protein 10 [Phialophora attinorum]